MPFFYTEKRREESYMEVILESTVSPYEEMLHYETLWALPGMTESRMTGLFIEAELPGVVAAGLSGSEKAEFDRLLPEVENFLENQVGFSVCLNGDYQYPVRLRDARHPVDLFYFKGDLSLLSVPSISIVGARSASQKGKARARRLAKELAEEKYAVISGLAQGIDNAGLESAMAVGGKVIGVVGTPVNQYYPKPSENNRLQDRISENHLLISQVPFYRYNHEPFQIRKHYFPRRNATMSAISRATVVVEASEKSGTLTQARAALSQQRPLFILSSCFENAAITWPENYEKKGAIRVRSTQDILGHLKSRLT